MGGQFPPDWGWSVCSGLQLKSYWFKGGQFHPDLGGQFDRILHIEALIHSTANSGVDAVIHKLHGYLGATIGNLNGGSKSSSSRKQQDIGYLHVA